VRRDEEALVAFLAAGPGKIRMLYRETVRRLREVLSAALPERVKPALAARRRVPARR